MSMVLMDFVEQNDALNVADTVGLMNGAEESFMDVYDDAGLSGETLTSTAMDHPCQIAAGFLMMGDCDHE